MDSILRLYNASCSYGSVQILSGVNLDVKKGQAVALLGSNGAGKSTLFKSIVGLASLRGLETPRPRLGYVPQHQDTDPTFPVTAYHVVEMGVLRSASWWQRALSMRSFRPQIMEALEQVGLADIATTRFGELSGGQRQRVLIARALVSDPQLLLLDEPFNGLDQTSRQVLLDTITRLKKHGVALLISTHDPILAQRTCDWAGLIADGTLIRMNTEDAVERYAQATSFLREEISQ